MAISIPISASATAVTAALREIQDAIKRAGQEGVAFSKLDLSHPELAKLGSEIRSVQQKFDDLARIGRGATAQAVRGMQRQGGVVDPLSWEFASNRTFPDEAERQRHQSTVGQYIFQNTRWQQRVATPVSTRARGGAAEEEEEAPAAGGGRGGGGMGMLGGIVKGALGFGVASLALAGFSSISSVVGKGITSAEKEATDNESLLRHTDEVGTDFDALRESVRKTTEGMGLNYREAQRLSMTWAKLTSDSSPEAISAGVRLGTGFSRAYGMDPSTGVAGLGAAVQQGMDPNRFALLVGEAAAGGKQGGQVEQVMAALLHWSESASRTLVTHTNERDFASMYAGMNAMGIPGFRGENASNIINTLDASLSKGGNAGPASMALTYRALQAQGVRDPYDVKYLTEGGMFATAKGDLGYGGGASVYQATMTELQKEYAGQPRNRLLDAMENHLGINMRQSQELLRYQPADLTHTQTELDKAHVRLESLDPTGIRNAVAIGNAGADDLQAWRQKLLARHGEGQLTESEQTRLQAAGPDELRTTLLQLVGQHGKESTEGSETQNSIAKVENAITKVGSDLLTPLNQIRDFTGTLVGQVADFGSSITDGWKALTGDKEAGARLAGKVGQMASNVLGDPDLTKPGTRGIAERGLAFFQSPEGGGWSRQQSMGILAQAGAESGFDPTADGDDHQAKGMFQWHPDRQAAIERHFGKKVTEMSADEQMKAKAWELSPSGTEAAAGSVLRGKTSYFGAGYSETVNDERPAYKEAKGVARGTYTESLDRMLSIAPLEVIHKTEDGKVIKRQELPVTHVAPPKAWGPGKNTNPRAPAPTPTNGSMATYSDVIDVGSAH